MRTARATPLCFPDRGTHGLLQLHRGLLQIPPGGTPPWGIARPFATNRRCKQTDSPPPPEPSTKTGQLHSCFGAQAIGSAFWGAVGTQLSVQMALVLCAGTGALAAAVVRPWRLSAFAPAVARSLAKRLRTTRLPQPQDPAPALTELLNSESGRVLEAVHYQVDPANRDAFLAAMREVRQVRLRAGAVV